MSRDLAFWALVALDGSAYDEARSAALESGALTREALASHAESKDPRARTQAAILLGRLDHAALYDEVTALVDAEDVERESRKLGGIAQVWSRYARVAAARWREPILPLCWEALLKHASDWPSWKLVTFVRMAQAVPHEGSIDPLLRCMEATNDDALAQSAGMALVSIPRAPVQKAVASAQRRTERTRARLADVGYEIARPPPGSDDD